MTGHPETLRLIVTACLVYLVGVISPGPNFLLMVATATRSRPAALLTALGFALAAMTWAGATALGLALLLSRVRWAHALIQVAGGAYLFYLGFRLLVRRGAPIGSRSPDESFRAGHSLWRGFATNITNPKSAAFFTSIFASIVPLGQPLGVLVALTCCIGVVSLGWHSLMAVAISSPPVSRVLENGRSTIDAVFGGILMVLGLRIVTMR